MNDRDGDATTGTPTDATPVTPSASTPAETPTPAPAPAPQTPEARTLPHVTGSSDARYVNAAPSWMDDGGAHQSYDAAAAGMPQHTATGVGGAGTGTVPPAFAAAPRPRRSRRWLALTGAAAAIVVVAGAAGGGAYAVGRTAGVAAAQAASDRQALELLPQLTQPGSGSDSSGSGGSGSTSPFGTSPSQGGSSQQGTSTQTSATSATDEEKVGVVTIVSTLNYDASYKSAGTGMVLTAGGLILTNNHVVQGATSIQVTVESTGTTYTADVVGTDATNDVAVLQLKDASGLTPVTFDSSTDVATGDAVHSTGNAEGTGELVTAQGTVLATDQAITVQSESGSGTESLSGLIEVDADVVSGDSGGPLRDADGNVVGIVTAASQGSSTVTGYAIPIDDALAIAKQIDAGTGSDTIQIGLPAFLGAQISSTATGTTTAGVPIAGTVDGSAAASAGLVAGDTVTAVDGTPVADASALTAAIQAHESGDQVSVTWTDAAGTSHTATVTLGDGPAA